MIQITTMGEFMDLLLQPDRFSGRLYVEWASRETLPEELNRFRDAPFSKETFRCFVEGLVGVMQDYIIRSCPDTLYEQTLTECHAVLKELHAVATECGLLVGLKEVDQPITYSEMAVAQGVVEELPDGLLKLTAKGEAMADSVKARIVTNQPSS
jgi:hypothetical protein